MIKNYLKIAWRNLIKDRQFTFLNLLGLAIGLACTLLIYLWVTDELQVDKFYQKDAQIYQVMQNVPNGDGTIETIDQTPGLLAKAIKDEIPEVEDAAVVEAPSKYENPTGILSIENRSIKASELYVSPNFFNIFSYQLIEGNENQALSYLNGVLLSRKMAMKLFHTTQNIIGKSVTWDRGKGFTGDMSGHYIVSTIVLIALLTVSYQSIKAAVANPVKSLTGD